MEAKGLRISALVGAFVVTGLIAASAGQVLWLINIPSWVSILALGTLLGAASSPLKDFKTAIQIVLSRRVSEISAEDLVGCKRLMLALHDAYLASSVFWFLIWGVYLLAVFEDPAQVGAGLAIAILSPMVGLILAEFVCSPIARTVDRLADSIVPGGTDGPPKFRLGLWSFFVLVGVSPFLMLLVQFSNVMTTR